MKAENSCFEPDAPISPVALNCFSPHCAAIDRGSRHGHAAGSKMRSAASLFRTGRDQVKCYAPEPPTSKHHRTAQQCWNNLLKGDIERFVEVMAHFTTGQRVTGRSTDWERGQNGRDSISEIARRRQTAGSGSRPRSHRAGLRRPEFLCNRPRPAPSCSSFISSRMIFDGWSLISTACGVLAGGRLDELARVADKHPPVLHAARPLRPRRGLDRLPFLLSRNGSRSRSATSSSTP